MVHYQLKIPCEYVEVNTDSVQNENVYYHVMKQNVYKGVCEDKTRYGKNHMITRLFCFKYLFRP